MGDACGLTSVGHGYVLVGPKYAVLAQRRVRGDHLERPRGDSGGCAIPSARYFVTPAPPPSLSSVAEVTAAALAADSRSY
eukprot:gene10405-biopygen8957